MNRDKSVFTGNTPSRLVPGKTFQTGISQWHCSLTLDKHSSNYFSSSASKLLKCFCCSVPSSWFIVVTMKWGVVELIVIIYFLYWYSDKHQITYLTVNTKTKSVNKYSRYMNIKNNCNLNHVTTLRTGEEWIGSSSWRRCPLTQLLHLLNGQQPSLAMKSNGNICGDYLVTINPYVKNKLPSSWFRRYGKTERKEILFQNRSDAYLQLQVHSDSKKFTYINNPRLLSP